ncbi:helix-turn-helix domain-containing protein [Kitasatospora sp. NPDC092948]|uniref:helix-turn-helix domain-containing protein n=1 Tax=Kitasatospora sp. NPDC092948 TaxID=3364088 RepID=UPI0037F26186
MIPAGQIPADDTAAADLYNLSVHRYRVNKTWETFPAAVKPLHREGAKSRIYDLGQLTVVARNAKAAKEAAKKSEKAFEEEIPVISRDTQILDPGAKDPTLKKDKNGKPVELEAGDLLDRDEAYAALPEERRPSWSTWLRMIAPPSGGAKTVGPLPTVILGGSIRLWSYKALLTWNADRTELHPTGHGYGRPKGTPESTPRAPRADKVERSERTRQLLAERPAITAEELAADLGVSVRTADRYLAEAKNDA